MKKFELIPVTGAEKIIETNALNIENDSVIYKAGKIFHTQIEHKYIRYSNHSGVYIRVYSKQDNYKKPILNTSLYWMNFVSDSIFDIDGDLTNDLALHWYPSSGCCLADIFNCYIYDKKKNSFRAKTEITNPTFYPKESKTYSMDYNHPGETNFYEIIWTKIGIDTLKSYAWKDNTQKNIVIYDFNTGKLIETGEMPAELKKLNGIEWFMMKPYETNE
jgi:hypothetical protein